MEGGFWVFLLLGVVFIIIAIVIEVTSSKVRELIKHSDTVKLIASKVYITQEYDREDNEYYDLYHVTIINEYFGNYSFSTTRELHEGAEIDCYIQDDHILCTEYDKPIPIFMSLFVGIFGALSIIIGFIFRGM